MGVPAKLTERQIKFAELLVYNEGRMSPAECAKEAGYTTRPRQAASELRNPKYSPLVVRYTGCLLYTSPSPRDRTRSRMPSSA